MPGLFYITGLEDSGYLFHRVLPLLEPHFDIAQGRFPDRLHSFESLVEVLRSQVPFEEPCFILGESFGSAVAFEYALRYPSEVAGLIVSGGLVRPPGHRTWRHLGMKLIARLPLGIARLLVRPVAEWQADRHMHPEHRQKLIDRLVKRSSVAMLQDAIRLLASYDVSDRLKNLAVPALALWGDRDQLVRPWEQRPLMEHAPLLRQVVFPSTSHICLLEQPEASAEEITRFAEEAARHERGIGTDAVQTIRS